MNDRILGICAIIVSSVYLWTARGFNPGFLSDPLGPRMFPYILGTVLFITGLYVVLRPDESVRWPDLRRMGHMLIVVAVLVVYVATMEWLGFLIATALAAGLLSRLLGAGMRAAVLNGLFVSIMVYGLFDKLLNLPLPAGLLGGL